MHLLCLPEHCLDVVVHLIDRLHVQQEAHQSGGWGKGRERGREGGEGRKEVRGSLCVMATVYICDCIFAKKMTTPCKSYVEYLIVVRVLLDAMVMSAS